LTLKASFCGQPTGFGAVGLLYRQIVIVLLPDFKYLTPSHHDNHRSDFKAISYNCIHYL